MTNGLLVIVLGPTGSGKSVLIEHIRSLHPEFIAPVSYTTRSMRPGEERSKHFYFLSEAEFKQHIAEGDFIEWVQYGGHYYGSLRKEILPPLQEGKVILDEMEVQGVRQLKAVLPSEQLISVFIDAGPWEELERRIRARAPITEEELAKRKKRYDDEMSFKTEATYVVQNPIGKLEEAKRDLEDIINSLLK
ncbi:guanylate kinase [Patescibacteria group bacterium]|nr:guanylate kinase [Patescibacteria group bacterium]